MAISLHLSNCIHFWELLEGNLEEGQDRWQVARAFNDHCYFARPVTHYSDLLLEIYHVIYFVLLFSII